MPDTSRANTHHLEAQDMSRGLAPLQTFRRRYTFAELSAAALTTTIDPAGFPANVRVVDVTTRIPTAFVGPSVTSLILDVGDAGTADELAADVDLLTADSTGTHQAGTYTPLTHEAAYAPRVTATAVGANLDVLTAGVVEITWTYHGAAPSTMQGTGDATV